MKKINALLNIIIIFSFLSCISFIYITYNIDYTDLIPLFFILNVIKLIYSFYLISKEIQAHSDFMNTCSMPRHIFKEFQTNPLDLTNEELEKTIEGLKLRF